MSALVNQLANEQLLPEDDFADIRRHARQQLMQHGFPDLKTEEWKYTPLRALEKRELEATVARAGSGVPELPFDAHVLHFDHGHLDVSSMNLPDGVRIEPIGRRHLEQADHGGRAGAFAWLNLARFEQGWRLVIDQPPPHPIVLAFTSSTDFRAAAYPRLLVEIAENVSASLVELHVDAGEGLIDMVEDIRVGKSARLDHVIRRSGGESVQVELTRVKVARDGDYRCHVLDTGGRLVRQDLQVHLIETGAKAEIDGSVLVDSKQHVDYHTAIDHEIGQTTSRESFRILGDGTGVGVFNGRIHIHAGADDSHSDLNTGNLLLSENARINIKPELEIHAEEVTASHGATIGQLDDDAMFYLRSRGLSAEDAAGLLKYGFAAAPLDGQSDESIRDWLLSELKSVL